MLAFDVKLIRDFGHCEDNIGAKFGFRRSCIVSHVDYFSRYERISTSLEPGTGYAWVACSINSQTAVRVVCVCQRQSFSFTQVSKPIFGLTVSLLLSAKNNISLSVCMFCRYEEMLANPAKHVLAIAKVRIEEQSANQDCMHVHAHVGRSYPVWSKFLLHIQNTCAHVATIVSIQIDMDVHPHSSAAFGYSCLAQGLRGHC